MLFKPLDKDPFARTILQAAEEAGLGPLKLDPATFTLKAAEAGADRTIYLENIYAEYRAARPWQRDRIIKGFTRHFTQVTQGPGEITAEQARAMLRPRIRPRGPSEALRLLAQVEGRPAPEMLAREIGGGHLSLEVVLDLPDSIMNVSQEQLAGWDMTFEEALAAADRNLLGLGGGRFRSPRPGLFVSDWDDLYDASRLHLSEVIAGLQVRGRPVAMVPNRSVLLVTGADDPEGLAAMAGLAEESLAQPRPMTGYAFRLDAGWVPYLPPEGHRAHAALRGLALQTQAGDYQQQKELLDALHQRDGVDLYVAEFMVLRDPVTRDLSVVTTWAEGADTLLPRAEQVGFVRFDSGSEPDILGSADWVRVVEVMGDRMEPQGLYPERYRVRAFPSPEERARLGVA